MLFERIRKMLHETWGMWSPSCGFPEPAIVIIAVRMIHVGETIGVRPLLELDLLGRSQCRDFGHLRFPSGTPCGVRHALSTCFRLIYPEQLVLRLCRGWGADESSIGGMCGATLGGFGQHRADDATLRRGGLGRGHPAS